MTGPNGMQVPIVSSFTWAVIGLLSLYAGAFNVRIFRAGVEAVPRETVEAAEALGAPGSRPMRMSSFRLLSASACRRSTTTSST